MNYWQDEYGEVYFEDIYCDGMRVYYIAKMTPSDEDSEGVELDRSMV